jgi:hypothetical protein
MISTHSKVSTTENALVQKVGEEMVILDAESGQYYTLNDMATEMLEHFTLGHNMADVVAHICDQYDVNEAEATADITEMLTKLKDKNLVLLD